MYKCPPTASIPAGGSGSVPYDVVEYQIVDPRWPEENGRSCLKGTRVATVEELEEALLVCVIDGPKD